MVFEIFNTNWRSVLRKVRKIAWRLKKKKTFWIRVLIRGIQSLSCLRFNILRVINFNITVFSDITPWSLVYTYKPHDVYPRKSCLFHHRFHNMPPLNCDVSYEFSSHARASPPTHTHAHCPVISISFNLRLDFLIGHFCSGFPIKFLWARMQYRLLSRIIIKLLIYDHHRNYHDQT